MAHPLFSSENSFDSFHNSPQPGFIIDTKNRTQNGRSVLGELDVDAVRNAQQRGQYHHSTPISTPVADRKRTAVARSIAADIGTPESLADDLQKFHIHSPEQDQDQDDADRAASVEEKKQPAVVSRGGSGLAQAVLFKPSGLSLNLPRVSDSESESESAFSGPITKPSKAAAVKVDINQAIEKHAAKDYDWVLSLPCDTSNLVKDKTLRRVSSEANVGATASGNQSQNQGQNQSQNQKGNVFFGCNLVGQRARSGSDLSGQQRPINSYTLLATPLDVEADKGKQPTAKGDSLVERTDRKEHKQQQAEIPEAPNTPSKGAMANTFLSPRAHAPPPPPAPVESPSEWDDCGTKARGSRRLSETSRQSLAILESPGSSVSRIEDTIEELDRLEDEFEAVNKLVNVGRVPSPDKQQQQQEEAEVVSQQTPARASTETKKPTVTPAKKAVVSSTPKSAHTPASAKRLSIASPAPGKRNSIASPASAKRNSVASPAPGKAATPKASSNKRSSVIRPASLLPPKPLAKSSKPLTKSTFELPGDAVARRLKEQREARRKSAALGGETPRSAAVSGIRQARSSKQLAIPTFELPGEAISRRKREEHEAKLRQQEEEERKRREFKARPIRSSIAPNSYPRDTISSRARQNREQAGAGAAATKKGPAVKNKRLSMVSSTTTTSSSVATRGRSSLAESLGHTTTRGSRAPSTSTGSISGQKSAVSSEDIQHQKVRGRDVLHRDNLLAVDRDREKRTREALAKQARQEAAERSRQLSREWAEKQKTRGKKVAAEA